MSLVFLRHVAVALLGFTLLITPATLQAQTKAVAKNTRQAARLHAPVAYELFTRSNDRDSATDAAIEQVTYLKLNQEKLKLLQQERPAVITITLPIGKSYKKLLLYKTDIFSPDFSARLKEGKDLFLPAPSPKGLFYRGILEDEDNALAALSFFESEMGGVLSLPGNSGNYNLAMSKQPSGAVTDNYLLFLETDVHNASALFPVCAGELTGGKQPQPLKATGSTEAISCRTVSLALHADYQLYLKNSGSTAATMNYLSVLFNGVATLFENDGVRLALKEMTIHVADDFYPTESSHDILYQFGNEINVNTTADLMQIVSGHTITTSSGSEYAPLGGVAWLDVLCSSPYYYSDWDTYIGPYSMINTVGNAALPAVPVYSWDISCSAHELGHNFGSPHTHSCFWNGDDTPIDGCGPTADEDYGDPSCPVGPIPSSSVKGTIMSYCHLLPGIGISFTNGFGPQPAALLRDKVASAFCLSDDLMPAYVVNHPDSIVYANSFCKNGSQLYCYDNQGDFDPANDRLVLIIANFDIDLLDLSEVTISMKTTPVYGSNTAPDAASSFYLEGAYSNWYVANREWTVSLNMTLPGETYYSFPFLQQDIDDLEGVFPAFGGVKDSLKWVVFRSETAALNPEAAPASDVTRYNYGTGAGGWSYSTAGYKLATIRTNSPVYGARFAVGKQEETHVSHLTNSFAFYTYPNPAQEKLYLKSNYKGNAATWLKLTNNMGSVLSEYQMQGADMEIDISHLPVGVYFLNILTDAGSSTTRFTKL